MENSVFTNHCGHENTKDTHRHISDIVTIFEYFTYQILHAIYLYLFYSQTEHLTFRKKIYFQNIKQKV